MARNKANNKVKKQRRVKEDRFINESGYEIKNFIIILIVVLIIVCGIYFLSTLIVNKRDNKASDNTIQSGKIDYSITAVGTILNRPYNNYYVMVYDSNDTDALYYSNLLGNYSDKEDSVKIYFCDLSNPLNSSYISNEGTGNASAKAVEDLSFGRVTLLQVQNGAIVKYLEDLDAIANELS